MSSLTVVMYHYVRPIVGSTYPGIKGLEAEQFVGQLEHLLRHYSPVTVADIVACAQGGPPLPARPLLLTFDDGYVDHVQHVFPALVHAGVSGAFFPVSRAVLERRVLDVNKVHFVLAAAGDPVDLVRQLEAEVEAERSQHPELRTLAEYRDAHMVPNRFDTAEVIYVKRMLQHELPIEVRARIVDDLFRRQVSADERAFADELYVSIDDLRRMVDGGMHIGAHGHEHRWLDRLSTDEQAEDIDRSLDLLRALDEPVRGFTFCYPYGAFNTETVTLLSDRGCEAAFTTRVGLAPLPLQQLLTLPRLDTNDLPTEPDAPASSWTVRAGAR